MAAVNPNARHLSLCIRSIRQNSNSSAALNASSSRFFSTFIPSSQEAQLRQIPEEWNQLDPTTVDNKRDERRVIRTGRLPIGSRRRRTVLRTIQDSVPFEQLPYQCFQEARKVLQQDREEKIKQIETQRHRIAHVETLQPTSDAAAMSKADSLRRMRSYLEELKILADINDPMVKKRFEDGQGDMNKPIYRYLADQKWREYKRKILMQRVTQMSLIPDILPGIDPTADVDLAFGRSKINPGEFIDSRISEGLPRQKVQVFDKGERLVSIVVVDADVPVPDKDSFSYRCHFIASNIPISPTQTSIPLTRMDLQQKGAKESTTKHIALPWLAPWANRGAPYHRLAVFVLEQQEGEVLDIEKIGKTKREGFKLRSFMDTTPKKPMKPIGVHLFRTQWDEGMADVMRRNGLNDQVDVEFKRKKIEPLPKKRRVERMRG